MLIHDIRSPLMIIMSACENLLHADLNEMEKRWAEKIQIQANRLNNQMNDMLLLAKMEENHLALSLQPTDVASLLEEIRQNHAPIAAARHLQLEIAIPEEPTVIEVDQSLFARVLDNLVSNAIKYTHPHTSVSIYTLKYHEEGVPWVKICVADEGPGIPEEYREKIFNKYEIINLKKNRGVTQIGLGLAFCKLVVDAHQGRINVCNNEPQGSIFSVSMRLL
jgi:signal transduction histidine kinase